jgi:hypothetical protein
MLLARIAEEGFRSRIVGLAGPHDAVLLMPVWLITLIAWMSYELLTGDAEAAAVLVVGFFGALGLLGSYMLARFAVVDGEPLVRCLRDAVSAPDQGPRDAVSAPSRSRRARYTAITLSKAFTLDVDGEQQEGPATAEQIHDAIVGLGADGFAIVASGPETFIQTVHLEGGFAVEKREGDGKRHFEACRAAGFAMAGSDNLFSAEEVIETFMAYVSGGPAPTFLTWKPMQLG